jgi:hypothetical protein
MRKGWLVERWAPLPTHTREFIANRLRGIECRRGGSGSLVRLSGLLLSQYFIVTLGRIPG